MNLTEATMLALQGKLSLNESRLPRKRAKKTENIDVNVDDKTSVSVSPDATIVETEEATIVVSEHTEEIAPVEDVIIPEDVVTIEEPVEVVEVPVESDETIIPEEILEEPVETILPEEPIEEPVELEVAEPEEETEEENEEEIEESKEVSEDKEKVEESLASDAADAIENNDRYNGVRNHGGVFFAHVIAEIAETMGDDYAEWLGEEEIHDIIDSIMNNDTIWDTLDSEIRELVSDKVDWIRREDPASRYYEGPVEESKEVVEEKELKIEAFKVEESENYDTPHLNEDITIYDIQAFVDSELGEQYDAFDYTPNACILVGPDGQGCIVDYEAVGPKFENTSSEIKLGIVDAKQEDGGIPIFPQYQAKVKVQDILEKAPSKVVKMRDFFTKYNYNSRCLNNFKELIGYLNDIKYFNNEEVVEEPKTESKKFSSKTFESAMTKYFTSKYKTVESVKVTKLARKSNAIKVEAQLINADKIAKDICLEMKQVQTNGKFTKYELTESKGLLKENKQDTAKTFMTTCNKDGVLECKYFISK
jgi:hypothetical protein